MIKSRRISGVTNANESGASRAGFAGQLACNEREWSHERNRSYVAVPLLPMSEDRHDVAKESIQS